MNEAQIGILAAFNTTMQTMAEVFMDDTTTDIQRACAHGGAYACYLLAKSYTDADQAIKLAKPLLNEAAALLGLAQED